MKNMGERRKAKQRRGRYITTGLTYIEGVFRVKTLDFFISFSSSRVNPAALMQCEHRITFTSSLPLDGGEMWVHHAGEIFCGSTRLFHIASHAAAPSPADASKVLGTTPNLRRT